MTAVERLYACWISKDGRFLVRAVVEDQWSLYDLRQVMWIDTKGVHVQSVMPMTLKAAKAAITLTRTRETS